MGALVRFAAAASLSLLAYAGFSGTASAQAIEVIGPQVLQPGGAETRTSIGPGVSCADEKGVRVCRAAARSFRTSSEPYLAGEEIAPPATKTILKERVVIKVVRFPPFRDLRTQGHFSGFPKSRPFTQGFYSDRVNSGQ
ncbi:MAG: hypothetical protein AAF850_01235 [Pseudomonadota bacterium]